MALISGWWFARSFRNQECLSASDKLTQAVRHDVRHRRQQFTPLSHFSPMSSYSDVDSPCGGSSIKSEMPESRRVMGCMSGLLCHFWPPRMGLDNFSGKTVVSLSWGSSPVPHSRGNNATSGADKRECKQAQNWAKDREGASAKTKLQAKNQASKISSVAQEKSKSSPLRCDIDTMRLRVAR